MRYHSNWGIVAFEDGAGADRRCSVIQRGVESSRRRCGTEGVAQCLLGHWVPGGGACNRSWRHGRLGRDKSLLNLLFFVDVDLLHEKHTRV